MLQWRNNLMATGHRLEDAYVHLRTRLEHSGYLDWESEASRCCRETTHAPYNWIIKALF